jgi:hypothetical protein
MMFLFLVSALVFSSAVVAVIRPIRWLGLGTRMRAAAVTAASGLVMGTTAVLVTAEPPPLPAETSVESATVPTAAPSGESLANVQKAYEEANGAMDHCAVSFQAIFQETGSRGASAQSLFPLAADARDRCRNSSMAFDGMRPPEGVSRESRRAFAAAFRTCALAYAGHQRAAEALMNAADNGLRPSLVARFRELGEEAATGKAICTSQILQATTEAGVQVGG